MSVSGISGSSFFQTPSQGSVQSRFQQFQQEFQQLGQDLQSGNLSQAQSDFATLQQNAPAGSVVSSSATNSSSPLAQAFSQLSQDLQAGNLSAAQTDFTNIQQDFQQSAAQGQGAHSHHHHHHRAESDSSNGPGSAINQAFGELGQALQSGNLQSAQQAYATLQQDFQQFAALGQPASGSSSNSSSAAAGSVNVQV